MLDKELGYITEKERQLIADFRELSEDAQQYILYQLKIAKENM